MINCKLYRGDEDKFSFDVEITGASEDILVELMKINAILIRSFRKVGIADEEIEQQLVNCIVAGFEFEKSH